MPQWVPIDIVGRLHKLPTLPHIVTKILQEISNPESSAINLAKIIASDQSITASVLRVVNSAYYGFSRRIGELPEAIVLLGYNEIRRIVITITAFRFINESSSYLDRKNLWRHALACGLISDILSKKKKLPLHDAFEAGLLHDIGKVIFDYLDPELFRNAVLESRNENKPLIQVEPAYFGTDHAEVGTLLTDKWNLPDSIVQPIRFHHMPDKSLDPYKLNVCLIAVANRIAYEIGLGDAINKFPPPISLETLNVVDLSHNEIEKIPAEIQETITAGIETFIDLS